MSIPSPVDMHPPPDPRDFDVPPMLHELPGGTLNTHSIHWYFMSSPFYDASSNNTSLLQQLRNDPDGQRILLDRHLFEARLRTEFTRGVRFLVVREAEDEGEPWVIQRQYVVDGGEEVVVQGTWYTQGTRIVAAPSVLHVVQLRMVGVLGLLGEVFAMGKGLGGFEPGMGFTQTLTSTGHEQGKTEKEREGGGSVLAMDASVSSQQQPSSSIIASPAFSDPLFLSSLALTNEWYDEYMDENPLQGEPGSFVFANTHHAVVNSRNKAAAAAAAAAMTMTTSQQQTQSQQKGGTGTRTGSATPVHPPSRGGEVTQSRATSTVPTALAAATTAGGAEGTGGGGGGGGGAGTVPARSGGKEKRRKSRGAASPVTPTTMAAP